MPPFILYPGGSCFADAFMKTASLLGIECKVKSTIDRPSESPYLPMILGPEPQGEYQKDLVLNTVSEIREKGWKNAVLLYKAKIDEDLKLKKKIVCFDTICDLFLLEPHKILPLSDGELRRAQKNAFQLLFSKILHDINSSSPSRQKTALSQLSRIEKAPFFHFGISEKLRSLKDDSFELRKYLNELGSEDLFTGKT